MKSLFTDGKYIFTDVKHMFTVVKYIFNDGEHKIPLSLKANHTPHTRLSGGIPAHLYAMISQGPPHILPTSPVNSRPDIGHGVTFLLNLPRHSADTRRKHRKPQD